MHNLESRFYIQDLGSTNGTFLNGKQLVKNKPAVIAHEDVVRLTKEGNKAKTPEYKFHDLRQSQQIDDNLHKSYIIDRELGTGANGSVSLAVHRQSGVKVAVKSIEKKKVKGYGNMHGDLSEDNVKEMSIARSVKHPNIVAVYELIETDRHIHMVMELASDGDLFERVVSNKKFSEKQTRWIFVQLLQAVAHLHSLKVAHRDLKPENILLEGSGEDAIVKIADFGLARQLGAATTYMKTTCGTPSYQAPEIYQEDILKQRGESKGYNSAVDMWSLGVILYICLAGFPPFSDQATWFQEKYTLREQIMKGLVVFPKAYWKNVSPDAIRLIKQMLIVDPEKRITAEEALHDPWITADPTVKDLIKQKLIQHQKDLDRMFQLYEDEDPASQGELLLRACSQESDMSVPNEDNDICGENAVAMDRDISQESSRIDDDKTVRQSSAEGEEEQEGKPRKAKIARVAFE